MSAQATQTGHTPGPWITQTQEGGNIEIIPSVDEGDLIATVKIDRPIRCGIKCGPDPGEKRANARLIAAAPALLAALLQARAWVAPYQNTPGHDAAASSMLRVIDRAIAQASAAQEG